MTDTVTILDRFYRDKWLRKIGDGEWKEMPLTDWHGKPPVVFVDWDENVKFVQTSTLRQKQLEGAK